MPEDKAIKTMMQEMAGFEGTEISSGIINQPFLPSTVLGEDYLSDWTIDTVNHMLNGDGQVSGVWKAIQLAILQGSWSMEPYKQPGAESPTPRDKKIADDIAHQLAEIWRPFLNEAVYYLPYGFALFEVTMKEHRGQIIWDRLAPRLQHTVSGWKSKDGHVDAVNQYVWDNNQEMYRDDIWIPGSRVLRLTNDQRGANFEGLSFMRGSYKHYLIKDAFYKIGAIQYERYGVGVPVGALPPNATPEQEKKFKEILRGLRSNEYSHLYCGKIAGQIDLDKILTILVPQGGHAGATGMLEHIQHHDILIARSMLAQFMSLGETSGGTRALSNDMSDLFLMNLEAVTGYISHVISNGHPGESRGIRDLVDINYGEVDGYPRWVCGRTKKTDSAAVAAVVAQLVQSGAMRPDDTLEGYLRGILGVPKDLINPREIHVVSRGTQKGSPVEEKAQPAPDKELCGCERTIQLEESPFPAPLRRGRFPWEMHVRFEEIRDTLDNSENSIVNSWRATHLRQVDAIGATVGAVLTRKDLEKIYSAEVPLQDELAADIALTLNIAHWKGKQDVKIELLSQTATSRFAEPDEEDGKILPIFLLQANKSAERLAAKTKQAVEAAAITALIAAEEVLWEDIRERAVLLSDQYARDESRFVNSAYGMGRNEMVVLVVAAGLVEERYYSAMLDMNTCYVCEGMDGAKYSETHFIVPNPMCLGATHSKSGGSSCRCLEIIVLEFGTSADDINDL